MLSFWDRSSLLKQGRERATGEKLKRLKIVANEVLATAIELFRSERRGGGWGLYIQSKNEIFFVPIKNPKIVLIQKYGCVSTSVRNNQI